MAKLWEGAMAVFAVALLAGCSQPSPSPNPSATRAPAIDSRLATDEARISALEQRLNALEAPRPAPAPVAAAARPSGITLTVTTLAEDQPASKTHTRFGSRAECETARKKALADAAANAQASSQTRVQQLPNGAALITPASKPPEVTAVCSG